MTDTTTKPGLACFRVPPQWPDWSSLTPPAETGRSAPRDELSTLTVDGEAGQDRETALRANLAEQIKAKREPCQEHMHMVPAGECVACEREATLAMCYRLVSPPPFPGRRAPEWGDSPGVGRPADVVATLTAFGEQLAAVAAGVTEILAKVGEPAEQTAQQPCYEVLFRAEPPPDGWERTVATSTAVRHWLDSCVPGWCGRVPL